MALRRVRVLAASRRSSRKLFSSNAGAAPAPKPTDFQPRGPVSWAGLDFMTAIGSGLLYYYQQEKEHLQTMTSSNNVQSVGKALLGGNWTLVNCDTQRSVTKSSIFGQYHLLYFSFTHCPDICPNELVRVGEVIDTLQTAHNVTLAHIFVTVDPKRDTIQQILVYKQDFHLAFKILTGMPGQIQAITKAYRVYFSKTVAEEDDDEYEDYLVDHSIFMYLIDEEGMFVDFFTQSAQVKDIIQRIVTAIKTKEQEYNS